jgi:hypothetical protein
VLIANVTLAGFTGTETATKDIALGLQAAGHRPMVYAPALGRLADDIRAAGIPVAAALSDLPEAPDIVHGHHHVQTVASLLHFPKAVGLFVCHDRTAAASAPPYLSRIRRFVAVDLNCLDRLIIDYGIPISLTRVIHNAVDTARFHPRPPLPPRPQRAAIFSNYAAPGTHLEPVREACRRLDLPLDVIGAGVGNAVAAPEQILGNYDLVFAKGRAAIEAMATGAAVVLCDASGLGPMITMNAFEELRWWNFGRRTLHAPLDPDAIVCEIERYDPADAAGVSAAIRVRSSLDDAIARYADVYREIVTDLPVQKTFDDELKEYLENTATRIGRLESELAVFQRPYRMDVLSDRACAALTVRITGCPDRAVAGEEVIVTVMVENGGPLYIGTMPPWPVNLSYRWLDVDTDRLVVAEGGRTAIPALSPGHSGAYAMTIATPSDPGRLRLRVALVQEGLRWLDQIDPPVAGEAIVSTAAAPGTPA